MTRPYDYLVLATGATHSYFGHPEWAPVAPGLKQIEDATAIRRKVLMAFEHAELIEDVEEQRRLLTFVVVGGGPTGVEMAGAIAEVAHHALPAEFRRIDPACGPRHPHRGRTSPAAHLSRGSRGLCRPRPGGMGVEVMTSARVTNCDERGVDLER